MKNYILYIWGFAFIVLSTTCVPDINLDNSQNNNIGKTVVINIKEYKTNLPISGAIFSTYYCNGYDIEFGQCNNIISLSSCITDNNGTCKCRFPEKNSEKSTIKKSMYWSKYNYLNDVYILQPEAWVNIHFQTTVQYPVPRYFNIKISGELGFYTRYTTATNDFNSTFTLYGNEENKVEWVLFKSSSSEILNSGSFILKPNKFENLTYTLTY